MCKGSCHFNIFFCFEKMTSIPALNLRRICVEEEQPLPPSATVTSPTDNEGIDEMDGEDSTAAQDSYRDSTKGPHQIYHHTAADLLGVNVHDITDVAVLQQKLIELRNAFVTLEQRYEQSLEAKEKVMARVLGGMGVDLSGLVSSKPHATVSVPFLRGVGSNSCDKAVQVGTPITVLGVPASITPRSARNRSETTSTRLRMAMLANRVPSTTPLSARVPATSSATNLLSRGAAGSNTSFSTNRMGTHTSGGVNYRQEGSLSARASFRSGGGATRVPNTARGPSGSPIYPRQQYLRPYSPAVVAAGNGRLASGHPLTPRY